MILKQPLELTNTSNKYDIVVNVVGGGQTGQAGAIRLAIARGLQMMDNDLRGVLKKEDDDRRSRFPLIKVKNISTFE